ncbi:uncharacterized protein N7529_006838 [Penicillium soppii]|uniref:uncharacterized protein n=1 Tax=Penicillium soppii TaxID=69789 RepID=UPI0025467097|nr:uncharacterized protein N7529_006838 [Penicillium soppii]KAJ5864922.1 hypothetical protein N7529_006838 [Penicillium soppii]
MAEFPPPSLQPLLQEISDLLKARNETVSVAETAAGGLISASLLSTPGASSIYKGGLTVYTLESRLAFAGWTQENIKDYKGPTTEIVANMAEHTRLTLGSTYAVSESGTAGPTGGTTRNRIPGYVAMAVSTAQGQVKREFDTESNNRAENMVAFARESLKLLIDVILSRAESPSL